MNGEEGRNTGEARRRRAFLTILGLGGLTALLPMVQGRPGSSDGLLGLAVAAGLLWCALVTQRSRSIPPGVRLAVPTITLTYLAMQLGIQLLTRAGAPGERWHLAVAASWAPLVLVTAWLLFDTGTRLRALVLGYYAALLAPAVLFGIVRGPAALLGTLGVMGPLLLASVAATVLLVEMSRLREQYAASRTAQHGMELMAHTDPLTELRNRRSLMLELTREMAVAARFALPLAVIEFDLDHFKEINDVYGHQTGDRVLVAVARYTERRLRATDIVGRLGGEEFLILAPGTAMPDATRVAEELRSSLTERPMANDRAWVTASFGVTVYEPGDTPEAMLARADKALYAAKREGRNRVVAAPFRGTTILGAVERLFEQR
jgi:diguanylate cyclase (GGDEF)-like protein